LGSNQRHEVPVSETGCSNLLDEALGMFITINEKKYIFAFPNNGKKN
jgi:hypothetical protein